jgi:hypothetical protein
MKKESQHPFQIKDFYGAVLIRDWLPIPSGLRTQVLVGWISIYEDTAVLGFKVRGADQANWCARVVGNQEAYTIPGCQIRGVVAFTSETEAAIGPEAYQVP